MPRLNARGLMIDVRLAAARSRSAEERASKWEPVERRAGCRKRDEKKKSHRTASTSRAGKKREEDDGPVRSTRFQCAPLHDIIGIPWEAEYEDASLSSIFIPLGSMSF